MINKKLPFNSLEEYQEYLFLKKKFSNFDENMEVPKSPFLRPITHWCSHYAVFFDDDGVFVGSKKLKFRDKWFSWKGKAYNFLPDKCSSFKVVRLLTTHKYYHYNINDSMPLILDKKLQPVLDNEVYKSILDSDLVKKLNPRKMNFLDFVGGWKGIVAILVFGAVFYYFVSGGRLT